MITTLLKDVPFIAVEMLWQELLSKPKRAGTLALAVPLFLLRRLVHRVAATERNRKWIDTDGRR
jgi:hypothetical protein